MRLLQPYDMEVGAGTSHTATFLRAIGPSPGRPPTCSPAAVPRTAATARTPTACSTTTSTRWCSSPRRPRSSTCTWARSPRSASTRKKQRRPVRRGRLGDRRRWARGAWAGRSGSTAWKSRSSPTSRRSARIEVPGPITGEITYGLERLAMYVQGVESIFDLQVGAGTISYGDVFHQNEVEQSTYNFEHSRTRPCCSPHLRRTSNARRQAPDRRRSWRCRPTSMVMKCSHCFNLLDARGAISVTERAAYIGRVRNAGTRGRAEPTSKARERLGFPMTPRECRGAESRKKWPVTARTRMTTKNAARSNCSPKSCLRKRAQRRLGDAFAESCWPCSCTRPGPRRGRSTVALTPGTAPSPTPRRLAVSVDRASPPHAACQAPWRQKGPMPVSRRPRRQTACRRRALLK